MYDRTIAKRRHGEYRRVTRFRFSNTARDKSRRLAIANGRPACDTRSCRMRSRRRPKIQQIGRAASLIAESAATKAVVAVDSAGFYENRACSGSLATK